MVIFVDIDGLLCHSTILNDGELDYNFSVPIQEHIDKINELYEEHEITIWTARGARTGKIDWSDFTKNQLKEWGVKYHHIRFDKPHFDYFIDDRTFNNIEDFIKHGN